MGARRRFLLFLTAALGLSVVAAGPAAAQRVDADRCRSCHAGLDDPRLADPALKLERDVHAERGFGCIDCHATGAGPGRLAPEAAAGFLGRPARERIPDLCGRCHSDAAFMHEFDPSLRVDQVAEYRTSVHGRLLVDGDPDVAVCTDCHPPHGIRPPADPESSVYPANVAELCGGCHADTERMAGHDVPTDQLAQYRRSVHGRLMYDDGDASAPTCNDCHGNHGAAPPGVSAVGYVCGQCHATMADYLEESGHRDLLARAGLAGCATCHGSHEITPVGEEDLAERSSRVCGRCHPSSQGAAGQFLAMQALIDSLKVAAAHSDSLLSTAENLGMEVSQAHFELEEVTNAITKARSAVHTLRVDPVRDEVRAGFAVTDRALERGRAALDEHRVRRVGLAGSSLIIAVLVGALLLKIREIEARSPAGTGARRGAQPPRRSFHG
jgi:hypothetical protein